MVEQASLPVRETGKDACSPICSVTFSSYLDSIERCREFQYVEIPEN